MKILIIAGASRSLINFRGDLIKDICKQGHHVIAVGPETGYEKELKDIGAQFVQVPCERTGTNPFNDVIYTKNLHSLIKKEKPDIVLGYATKPIIYGPIAAHLAGVRDIVSLVTGFGYVSNEKNIKGFIIRSAIKVLSYIGFKCSTKVIFQNPDDMDECVSSGLVNKDKCEIVNGSGVSTEKFKPAPFPITYTFLMIGRILRDKGVMEYLEAARMVKRKYPQVKIQLLGGFDTNPNALNLNSIQPYIDDGSIDYLGKTKDVRPYISNCSVKVLPSYHEGVPRSVLEAMAMARPIITTDAPGCRETVVDGVNGFLVPVKNADVLAEKMIWMIEHSEETEKMGKESLKICREKFDVKKVNKEMMRIMGL